MEEQKKHSASGDVNAVTGAQDPSTAEGRFGQAKAFVGEKVDAATRVAKEKYDAAADAVKEKVGAVRQQVEDVDFEELKGQATSYVRQNPVQALAISLGVGFLVGFLVRKATHNDD
jgi:ElaB/YqjD/DUF883 family membrane-anchored ribosome-binding protein